MTAKQRIRNGIVYLEKYGWQRGSMGKGDSHAPACLLGSLMTERELGYHGDLHHPEVVKALGAMGFPGSSAAIDWNDYTAAGRRQVIARLKRGLKVLEAQ